MTIYRLENNVNTKLVGDITESTVNIVIENAANPYNNPIAPGDGEIGTITIIDDHARPTKIEIVYFTGYILDKVNNNLILTGVERGKEDTQAQSFVSGSIATQALTRDAINSLINSTINSQSDIESLSADINRIDDSAFSSISVTDIENWNDAFSWGDHSDVGYLTNIESESISSLQDIDTSGVSDGKILKYNSSTGNFEIADDENTIYVSSDFDHNNLTNYDPEEHVNWTIDQEGFFNIHKNNIPIIDGGSL